MEEKGRFYTILDMERRKRDGESQPWQIKWKHNRGLVDPGLIADPQEKRIKGQRKTFCLCWKVRVQTV